MEKNLKSYIYPDMELVDENIEWEQIKNIEMFSKSLDNLSEVEQLEYILSFKN